MKEPTLVYIAPSVILNKVHKLIDEVQHHIDNNHKELSATWILHKLEEIRTCQTIENI